MSLVAIISFFVTGLLVLIFVKRVPPYLSTMNIPPEVQCLKSIDAYAGQKIVSTPDGYRSPRNSILQLNDTNIHGKSAPCAGLNIQVSGIATVEKELKLTVEIEGASHTIIKQFR